MRTLRALVISDATRKEVDELVAWANQVEHWYDPTDREPGWTDRLPGNSPGHIYKIFDGYRCVYSITKMRDGKLYRHLSISVDSEGFPSPEAVLEIGRLFGFTGEVTNPERVLPNEWLVHLNKGDCIDDHCIVVGQDATAALMA